MPCLYGINKFFDFLDCPPRILPETKFYLISSVERDRIAYSLAIQKNDIENSPTYPYHKAKKNVIYDGG